MDYQDNSSFEEELAETERKAAAFQDGVLRLNQLMCEVLIRLAHIEDKLDMMELEAAQLVRDVERLNDDG